MILPLANMFQILAGLAAIAIVLGLVAYGFLHGIFRSVLVGMQALVSFIVALTFIPSLTELLITIDTTTGVCIPCFFGGLSDRNSFWYSSHHSKICS